MHLSGRGFDRELSYSGPTVARIMRRAIRVISLQSTTCDTAPGCLVVTFWARPPGNPLAGAR